MAEDGASKEPEELTLREIYEMKEEGKLFAELEGTRYVLMLYELYPNNTTSGSFVEDQAVVSAVGSMTGLGPPTDEMGWGIWVVDEILQRKEKG